MPSLQTDRVAVIYVRLSVDNDTSTSPERQLEACRDYVARQGWTVVGELEDIDRSGGRGTKRPGLDDAVALSCELGAVLVVAKLDRLARSFLTFAEVVERLESDGATVASVAEQIDLSTPGGRMLAHLLAIFAEFERDTITDRIRSSKAYLARENMWNGGQVPFGFEVHPHHRDENHKELRPIPSEAAVIEAIATRAIAGENLTAIAAWLNRESIPTRRANTWTRVTVNGLLSSRALIGDGNGVADRILTDDQFARLQEAIRVNDGRTHRPDRPYVPGLLNGVLHCAACSAPMRRTMHRGFLAYKHPSHHYRPGLKNCQISVGAKGIEAHISELLAHELDIGGEPIAGIIASTSGTPDPYVDIRAELAERVAALELAHFVNAELTTERYGELRSELEERIEALPTPEAATQTVETYPEAFTVAVVWDGLTEDDTDAGHNARREFVAEVIDRIEIGPAKKKTGPRFDPDRIAAIKLRAA